MYLKNFKYLFKPLPIPAPPLIPINTSENLYNRIMACCYALEPILGSETATEINGHFTWLTEPNSGRVLTLDVFYPKISYVCGIELAEPICLIVETLAPFCIGPFDSEKGQFFFNEESYEQYKNTYEWKRSQITGRKIPFLELDPSPESNDLNPYVLRRKVGSILDILL